MAQARVADNPSKWITSEWPTICPHELPPPLRILIDFWTYSCINCLRALPYVKAWSEKYKDAGLVVIGLHTPEFAFEKELSNVERAVHDLKIDYPVAVDSDYKIWQAFNNQYWPAHYFIDEKGRIRYQHFGEGEYDASEQVIRQLLKENGAASLPGEKINATSSGAEAAPDMSDVRSPETYIGYRRAENFASKPPEAHDLFRVYTPQTDLSLNQWALAGNWKVGPESAVLEAAPGAIVYRFHARDLHLVLGPVKDGKPIRFRVTLDGVRPGEDQGSDIDANGFGTVQLFSSIACINSSGKKTPLRTERLRSNFSILACRPLRSRLDNLFEEDAASRLSMRIASTRRRDSKRLLPILSGHPGN
jgi:thiol-disulfide isomerase/thioredoxin